MWYKMNNNIKNKLARDTKKRAMVQSFEHITSSIGLLIENDAMPEYYKDDLQKILEKVYSLRKDINRDISLPDTWQLSR